MQVCHHFLITGRVQGVSFRYYAHRKALELNLVGWVRNRRDGKVEALACGNANDVLAFQHWLAQGPTLAQVTKVDTTPVPYQSFTQFTIQDGLFDD